jgi:aldehyde:ferredoxin oxidoreductase
VEVNPVSELYGYTGKIARINLTTGEVTHVSTWDYVPQFIGGRGVCNKIFWDEVGPGVKAFDPENKLIFMTGPTTGTGIPSGGRTVITGIAPQCFPEQYSWSGIGGWFGAELKYAGYDGLILEGRVAEPSYIWIEDDKIQILSAAGLWGMYTYDTQLKLEDIHGKDVKSLVIGPGGENLVRGAIIASNNENAAGKGGYGAVFGSKNLKAITVRGTGSITPADVEGILKLRHVMGNPLYKTNPVQHLPVFKPRPHIAVPVEGGVQQAQVSCSHGCNQHCNLFLIDVKSATSKSGRANQVNKCVGVYAFQWMDDCGWTPAQTFATEKNNNPACMMQSNAGSVPPPDLTDPAASVLYERHFGDTENFWDADYDRGAVINDLCNQYGINKWDVIVWLMPWLVMGKREGVLDDLDLGMEIDPGSAEFMKYLLDMIVYRKGYYGNLFAEGMARAIRVLGKKKYGDTIYRGRYSNRVPGMRLDIPISLESAWGYSLHWNGRGFQGAIDIAGWLPISLMLMTSSRDSQSNSHHHDTYDYMRAVQNGPCRNPLTAKSAIMNENKAELKEALTSCDWQLPNVFWTTAEAEIFNMATGMNRTEKEMNDAAERIKNLFRAILIRNYGRTREMEVNEVLPMMSYPDADGRTVNADEYNDLVDMYYEMRGWDLKTGWPTRATYERYGLKEVADELETLGKLPDSTTLKT